MPEKNIFPKDIVVATEVFDVHQDMEVPIPGFLVIKTMRDIKSFSDFNSQEIEEFLPLLIKVRKALREVLNVKDVYFFQNEDSEHNFHIWIFPRHQWMEKFGRKIQSVRPIVEYAKENMVTESNIKEVKEAVNKLKAHVESSLL